MIQAIRRTQTVFSEIFIRTNDFCTNMRKQAGSSSSPPLQLEPEGNWPSSGQHGLFSEPV